MASFKTLVFHARRIFPNAHIAVILLKSSAEVDHNLLDLSEEITKRKPVGCTTLPLLDDGEVVDGEWSVNLREDVFSSLRNFL